MIHLLQIRMAEMQERETLYMDTDVYFFRNYVNLSVHADFFFKVWL